jgi:diguanylate cyclase (GGDEF)-like protein
MLAAAGLDRAPDLAATLHGIATAARSALGADRATCYVVDATGVVDAVYTTETEPRQRAFLEATVGLGPERVPIWSHQLAFADPLVVCEDLRADPDIPPALAERLGAGAFVGVRLEHPSVMHDAAPALLGTLFCTFRRPRAISPQERVAARGLANLATLALANARMEVEAAQGAERYRALAAAQAALSRVATLVATEGSPEAVFARVAMETGGLLGVEAAIVARFTPGWATILGAWGDDATLGARVPTVGNSVLSQVAGNGRAAFIDRYAMPELDPSRGLQTPRHGHQVWVAVPIEAGGRPWGALLASTTRRGGLSADAQTQLEPFADLVSLAITNAEARTRLTAQSTTDPLTGLTNHGTFFERLHAEHKLARRHRYPLSLVLIDLDHFTRINDVYGQPTGDRVLVEVAERLRALLREEDTLARVGRGEFAWLLPNSDRRAAWAAAERARRVVAKTPFSKVGSLSISGGVAELGPDMSINELFRRADAALSTAKSQGRNTCVPYDGEDRATPDMDPVGSAGRLSPSIARLLDLAREQLGIALVAVAQLDGGEEIWRYLSGDGEAFGLRLGVISSPEHSYCPRVADGRLPALIRDARADPRVRDLPLATTAGAGALIGVPITLPSGGRYGVLCGLSPRAEPSLGERDVRLLHNLANMLGEEIERGGHRETVAQESHGRIRRVLGGRGIGIVLQPMVELSGGRVIAAEALARFAGSPRRAPNIWFAEAASAGFGVELELAAIGAAIAKLGHVPASARLSINVSPQTLLSGQFNAVIAGIPGERLAVELTEHAPVDDYEALLAVLVDLRATGAHLMIDDAGAGFSSLRHILDLHPDVIKLDLALTHNIEIDPGRQALTASLVGFAREIGATLVAEGIESQAALDTLRALKVTHGQGNYLARPARGRVPERVILADWRMAMVPEAERTRDVQGDSPASPQGTGGDGPTPITSERRVARATRARRRIAGIPTDL